MIFGKAVWAGFVFGLTAPALADQVFTVEAVFIQSICTGTGCADNETFKGII